MKWSLVQSKLKRLIKHRNLFVRLAFMELGIIALLCLGIFYAFYQQKVVVVPATLEHRFWVSQGAVSPEYLMEMTYFFMALRLNVSPATAGMQRELLLRHTDPTYYQIFKNLLVEEEDKITKERISVAFFPVGIRVDPHTLMAEVTGDLVSTVGSQSLPTQRMIYEVNYRYRNGRLFIASLKEKKPHG